MREAHTSLQTNGGKENGRKRQKLHGVVGNVDD